MEPQLERNLKSELSLSIQLVDSSTESLLNKDQAWTNLLGWAFFGTELSSTNFYLLAYHTNNKEYQRNSITPTAHESAIIRSKEADA